MTTPGALSADLGLMTAVAGRIDARNAEIRGMLGGFIGQMTTVPPAVWGGAAAASFRDVVERWNAESGRLHHALERIAQTIRQNELALRSAADGHAQHIGAVAGTL